MSFSYENYMNLIWHLNYSKETVPSDIAKRIVSHGIAPVITVTSTADLDRHIQDIYGLDSMYHLLRFFGGCVSDRDQANEKDTILKSSNNNDNNDTTTTATSTFLKVPEQNIPNQSSTVTTPGNRRRSNSNSLLQRDHTQLQFIRFSKSLPDLLSSLSSLSYENKDTDVPKGTSLNYKEQLLSENHSLEIFLRDYLHIINENTLWNTDHLLLRKSIYHNFFSQTLSSTKDLSPFESFNHPIVSLFALDISKEQTYEDARELLTTFKNLNKIIDNFPPYLNINDILPIFLLCYDADSTEQTETCQSLIKKFKKQLFVESVMLPLWKNNHINQEQDEMVPYKFLHEPVMTSLDEILILLANPGDLNRKYRLPSAIINEIYNMLDILVYDLLIPFMQRKISYWNETIMAPRKSIFHGSKFLKRFINKSNQQQIQTYKTPEGIDHFLASSNEFLLRKLADWSLMISDFKTAYTTYDSLSNDLDNFPLYLASCLEWCSVSLLMGAQSIVTVKMIKNDITPLIERAVEIYKTDNRPILETRCMLLCTELFLSLSDSWTSTPYAIHYLETILSDGKLSSLAKTLIWERLSDCYASRIDPRVRCKVENNINITSTNNDLVSLSPSNEDGNTLDDYILKRYSIDILSKGFTRNRKAAFFRLIAAKKWAEQGYWRQVHWCLKDIHHIYEHIGLYDRHGLMLKNLHVKLQEKMTLEI
ncbi:Trs85p PWA37_001893 [Arxiozyma heterogenica]|uniref:Uncharacterized protein n=1 Tax=Arxiozyma heterogenica TaxID=278026 RepID=A0AAN7W4F6_9SACH|nr:hypothetical protein RI543_001368 [Kazachstania heterogenica]